MHCPTKYIKHRALECPSIILCVLKTIPLLDILQDYAKKPRLIALKPYGNRLSHSKTGWDSHNLPKYVHIYTLLWAPILVKDVWDRVYRFLK